MKTAKYALTALTALLLLVTLGFGYAAIWLPDAHDHLFNTAFLTLMVDVLVGAVTVGFWGTDL